ncbi:hypothetical protein, partial [Klebsiella grimontii]|uniref:hypothetical protein n=1 Tax=Klebsiella grimontii TaxID=2058152 RepID=UPI0025A115E4
CDSLFNKRTQEIYPLNVKMQNTIYPCKHLFTASHMAVFFGLFLPTGNDVILFNSAGCALNRLGKA